MNYHQLKLKQRWQIFTFLPRSRVAKFAQNNSLFVMKDPIQHPAVRIVDFLEVFIEVDTG